MVCNGNSFTHIGRCIISPRDEWLHYGCLPDYTSSITGCHAYKTAVVDGAKDVQDVTDCSMRHADEALPFPVWRSDGGDNPRCATLEADEFLEVKFNDDMYSTRAYHHTRIVMRDDGNLQMQYKNSDLVIAPFEANYHVGASLLPGYGFSMGNFVAPYTRNAIGRPPYHARLTATSLDLVNGVNETYWRAPFDTRFDPAYVVGVRWGTATSEERPGQFRTVGHLYACGVPVARAPCASADCSDQVACTVLQANIGG